MFKEKRDETEQQLEELYGELVETARSHVEAVDRFNTLVERVRHTEPNRVHFALGSDVDLGRAVEIGGGSLKKWLQGRDHADARRASRAEDKRRAVARGAA